MFVSKNRYFWLYPLIIIGYLISPTPVWSCPDAESNRQNDYLNCLSYFQKNQLINLLRGSNSDGHLLEPSLRIKIANQLNSLSPRTKARLIEGKRLPLGITKTVRLPNQINDYINLSNKFKILVFGSSVLIIDPSNNKIIDIFEHSF